MFSEEVTRKDGSKTTVSAHSKEDLNEAVKNVKGMEAPTYPNINVPVAKGKDLLEVDDALNVHLADGRGAHNSPNDAVREDGSLSGDPKVASPGAGEAPLKAAGSGTPIGDAPIEQPAEEKEEDTDTAKAAPQSASTSADQKTE